MDKNGILRCGVIQTVSIKDPLVGLVCFEDLHCLNMISFILRLGSHPEIRNL